jgi:hypothetical protein
VELISVAAGEPLPDFSLAMAALNVCQSSRFVALSGVHAAEISRVGEMLQVKRSERRNSCCLICL